MHLKNLKRAKWITPAVAFLFSSVSLNVAEAEDFKLAVATAPVTLDATKATGAASSRLLKLMAPSLLELGSNSKESALAKVESADSQTYTVTLKSVSFSDGEALTAQHVADLYNHIRAEGSTSPLKGYLKDVELIEVQSASELVVRLSQPSPWFWSAFENIPVVKVNEPTVGVGAYELVSHNDQGDVLLKRKDGDTFEFKVVKDPVVRLLKLMRGEVDIMHADFPSEMYEYGLSQGLEGMHTPSASYTYLGFNLESGSATDLNVRKAIELAIDRMAIMRALLGSRAVDARSLLVKGSAGRWEAPQAIYNPEQAKELLSAAGYTENASGERLKLHMSVTTNPFVLRLAQVIQQQLKEVGITLEISSAEWGTFYGNIKKGNFESYILSWVGQFKPDFFNFVFHSSMMPPNGANRGRFASEEMDRTLDGLMTELDEEKRNALAVKVQQIQHENRIYIPLWRGNHLALFKKGLDYKIPVNGGYSGLDELGK